MLNLEKEKQYISLEKNNKKIINQITGIRIILFILIVVCWISFFTLDFSWLFLVIAICLMISFGLFLGITNKFYQKEKYLRNILLAYSRHKNRREGKTNNSIGFFDKGLDFKRNFGKKNPRIKYLIEDVDLFGEKSLYQNICSAKSILGRTELANSLVEPAKNRDRLTWSEKVFKLGNSEQLVELEAALLENNSAFDMDYESFLNSIVSKFANKKRRFWGLLGIYILDVIIILLAVLKIIPLSTLVLVLVINLYYSTFFSDDLNKVNATKIYDSLSGYKASLNLLKKQDLSFLDSKYKLEYFSLEEERIKKVASLWQIMSYKSNILFKLLLNSLICFEALFQLYYNKRLPKKEVLHQIFSDISDLENLASLSNIVADYNSTIPLKGTKLEFVSLVNPLIKDCVPNSFSYQQGVILTGSNMSGKTTFLRTIALNNILMMAGGCVCADKFISPDYLLFTSLRIKDEMSEGISTFYAEIEKIKEMIESGSGDIKKLCLVDEIFKGTNTLDRIYGATKLIEKLNEIKSDFLISTHDFELCDLPQIDNYHFSETYDANYTHISFDYSLKKGKSGSTNAIFLLKSSGIIK